MKKTKFTKSIFGLTIGLLMSYLLISPTIAKAAPTYTCDGGPVVCVTVEVLRGTVTFYNPDPDAIT